MVLTLVIQALESAVQTLALERATHATASRCCTLIMCLEEEMVS